MQYTASSDESLTDESGSGGCKLAHGNIWSGIREDIVCKWMIYDGPGKVKLEVYSTWYLLRQYLEENGWKVLY